MSQKEKKTLRRARVPSFEKYYATNITCGLTSHDVRVEIMNEKLTDKEGLLELVEALIIFSPIGAKKLLNKLSEVINIYEEENGTIKLKKDAHTY